LAATRNLTGAWSRDTLVPERSLPVSVPSATTPLAVAWNLVIFALIESVDEVAALADAGTANATAAANAASMMVGDFMLVGTRPHAAATLRRLQQRPPRARRAGPPSRKSIQAKEGRIDPDGTSPVADQWRSSSHGEQRTAAVAVLQHSLSGRFKCSWQAKAALSAARLRWL